MKINQERQVRFDELIKYVWDKRIVEMNFKSKKGVSVYVHSDGDIDVNEVRYISKDDLFTITEEVEITEDATINLACRIKTNRGWQTFDKNETTINKIINIYKRHPHAYLEFIYLLNPNGSIGDLIWSKERGLID